MCYSLRSFKACMRNKHVKVFSDSHVGVQIMNKTEKPESSDCNDIAKILGIFVSKIKFG